MIIKHDFNVHFVQKQTNKKFLIFDQNHGLTPLQKSQYGNSVKSIFLYSRRALFLTRWSWDIISRLILLKKNKEDISNFGQKSWVNTFKKSQYDSYVKSIFFV